MSTQMIALIHDGIVTLIAGGAFYGVSLTTAALVAILARNPARRRDARKVLALLVRRATEERPVSGRH